VNRPSSFSRRAARRFWGWGNAHASLDARELATLEFMVEHLGASYAVHPPPRMEEFALRAPRIKPPSSLAAVFSGAPLDRLTHSYGKSYADLARMWLRDVPNPPDWVAYPDDEQAVVDLLDWAAANNVAVVQAGRRATFVSNAGV
jgi:alkyldihydroxyacetonephosphate synthase